MKLDEQVCSLEQAKKLHELGLKAESYFYFNQWNYKVKGATDSGVWQIENKAQSDSACPALTVAELFALTPGRLAGVYRFHLRPFGEKGGRTYRVWYMDLDGNLLYDMFNDTLPWLLADNLIYMLEKRYIEVEEINEGLKIREQQLNRING